MFRTALDGRYLDCNEAYARIYSYASREEVLASNVLEVYSDPANRAERLARLRARTTITNSEAPMRRRDGSLIWVLHNITLQKDEHGNEVIDGIVLDVTERKLAEAKILDWKNRYEAALLASGQIIYEWLPQSNQVTFGGNLQTILDYSPEEPRSLAVGVNSFIPKTWKPTPGRWTARLRLAPRHCTSNTACAIKTVITRRSGTRAG